MPTDRNFQSLALSICIASCFATVAYGQQLGTIDFPTSGSAAAQPAFLDGVKELYSFEYAEAAIAFQKAEHIDPNFAMAYWGEAMSYNHPMWGSVDLPAGQKALEKFAPTSEARMSKAKTEKEKAYLDAVNVLFDGPGEKGARDSAYSDAMAKMYARWPEDHEVAVLYALSVLGTLRPGDPGFRRQALAASICLKVFQENPNHPGAAHFIIHAFDDPDHAILALPAARAYAKIAPSAAHAVHMPSHIFLQLGMWQDVVKSNTASYQSSMALIQRLHVPEGKEDFHALYWLEYGNLMLGNFDEAKKDLDLAKAAVEQNPGDHSVLASYQDMRARYILETGRWEKIWLEAPETSAAGTSMTGMTMANNDDWWTFVTGLSAVHFGELARADQAITQLRAMRDSAGHSEPGKHFAIMTDELTAEADLARGQKDHALRVAKEAADIDRTLASPSGPPDVLKPGVELYGDVLLATGHAKEAIAIYEEQLLRTPNRRPAVKSLAEAKAALISATTVKPL
jgi:tetratricopeptide (TPR) repeat protein